MGFTMGVPAACFPVCSIPFCVGAFGVVILAMGAILQTATGISPIPAALTPQS